MSNESSDTDIDVKVERLKKKYLERRKRVVVPFEDVSIQGINSHETKYETRVQQGTKRSPASGYSYREMKCYNKALKELFKAVTNRPQRLDGALSPAGSEDELGEEYADSLEGTNIQCTETVPSSSSCVTEPLGFVRGERLKRQKRVSPHQLSGSPPGMGQVYQEMLQIYEKLQAERIHQQHWEAQLLEREQQLQQREKLLLHHQHTLHQIKGVEEEVHGGIQALQEQHQQEISQLNNVLKEKTKENRRIKSSFDSIKELNDTMKKQLNDISEQNKRLENQSRKVQARLENLQRKHEYSTAHRSRENVAPKFCECKPSKQDKPSSSKQAKGPASPSALKLLVVLLDWVLDRHLVQPAEAGYERGLGQPAEAGNERGLGQCGPPASSPHEKCWKVLPLLTEQLQQAAAVDPTLQLPLLKFIYWSLRQLDHSPQSTLTSTLRRLGEEVSRGSGDPGAPPKARAWPLCKSPCLHTRFLSTLIILRTITQVDLLAQALDALHSDLRSEEGRALFLQYQALSTILALLRGGNPGLLAPSVDILLQMSGESRLLTPFLEACGTDEFFRSVSLLLRNPRLELTLVEKVAILLQKLSNIRKNKRLFEVFSLHLLLQEVHRTADPAHTFLSINLSSILFNLDMLTRP